MKKCITNISRENRTYLEESAGGKKRRRFKAHDATSVKTAHSVFTGMETDLSNTEKAIPDACRDRLRSVFSKSFYIEESERRRFATVLHEQVCQTLATSRMKLGALREEATTNSCHKALDEIYRYIDQVIEEMRAIAFDLSPLVLYELGLETAIESLVDNFQHNYRIPIECKITKTGPSIFVILEVLLFRVVRELLLNSIFHARPDKIQLSFKNIDGAIHIDVVDNGSGFDVQEAVFKKNGKQGFGLLNIQERLEHLNGSLEIHSEKGEGTLISIYLNTNNSSCESFHSKWTMMNEESLYFHHP